MLVREMILVMAELEMILFWEVPVMTTFMVNWAMIT